LGVKLPRLKSDGHATWTEAQIAQYEATHPIGTKARLALALSLYSCQRVSDVVRMGPQHMSNGTIAVRQKKTKTALRIPIHPHLQAVLDATPS
jgi:integrase